MGRPRIGAVRNLWGIRPRQKRINLPYIARAAKGNTYNRRMERKKGSGALKKSDKNTNERCANLVKKQDAYLSGLTMLLHHTTAAPVGDDGCVSYATKYARCKEGYPGRVYAQGIALSKMPRRVRQVAYTGLNVRDWDVEMAYFTFAVQVVDKLKPKLASRHFHMDTLRMYLRDRRSFWNSLRETNSSLADADCKRLFNAVFNGGAIEEKYTNNAYVQDMSREGRVMRWLATYMIPDLYTKLDVEGRKNWTEASAQSYFLAGVEARVLEALVEHCVHICSNGAGRVMDHISLQFDGAEVVMRPFPADFKSSSEIYIAKKTGFTVNLVEKSHKFTLERVISEAIAIERIARPDARSPLFERGNCILLAMFLLEDDKDLCGTYEDVARNRAIAGPPVRSYMDCLSFIGGCSMSLVSDADLKVGRKYIIHADGKDDEPYCLPMYINSEGIAEVSASTVTYLHKLPDMRDILAGSIDEPIVFEYTSFGCESASSSQRAKTMEDTLLRNLLCG